MSTWRSGATGMHFSKKTTLTDHAVRRAQSRGVSPEAVRLATELGKRERVRDGKFKRRLGRSEVKTIARLGLATPADLDKLRGVTVVTDESGPERVVITVTGKCV